VSFKCKSFVLITQIIHCIFSYKLFWKKSS